MASTKYKSLGYKIKPNKNSTTEMIEMAESAKFSLNTEDWKKIGKGALIAFGGAFLYSVADWLAAGSVDWQTFFTVCLPAAVSVGINALAKWMQGN